MKFKKGDIVTPKPGGLDIWVKHGIKYKVLSIIKTDPVPANVCYRNCGHSMHDRKPSKTYLNVIGEFGKEVRILSSCFVKLAKSD
jgi:hypothetical protein